MRQLLTLARISKTQKNIVEAISKSDIPFEDKTLGIAIIKSSPDFKMTKEEHEVAGEYQYYLLKKEVADHD